MVGGSGFVAASCQHVGGQCEVMHSRTGIDFMSLSLSALTAALEPTSHDARHNRLAAVLRPNILTPLWESLQYLGASEKNKKSGRRKGHASNQCPRSRMAIQLEYIMLRSITQWQKVSIQDLQLNRVHMRHCLNRRRPSFCQDLAAVRPSCLSE